MVRHATPGTGDPAVTAARSARVAAELGTLGLAAALLFEPDNVRFATGYNNGSDASLQYPEGWALVFADGDSIVWDHPQSAELNPDVPAGVERRYASGWDWLGPPSDGGSHFAEVIADALREHGGRGGPLAIDRAAPSVYARLSAAGISIREAEQLLMRSRSVKNAAEIRELRAACEVCDAGLRQAGAAIEPGVSTLDVWHRFAAAALSAGAEFCTAPPAGLDHTVRAGDLISIDGCIVNEGGYPAHLARTVPCGDADTSPLDDANRRLASLIEACRPGTPFSDLCGPGVFIHGCGTAGKLPVIAEFPLIIENRAPVGALSEGNALSVGVECSAPSAGRPALHVRDEIVVTSGGPVRLV